MADQTSVKLPFAVKGNYPDEQQMFRYIVHETVEEFESLVSVTDDNEETGDRIVIVYKNGHQPEEENSFDAGAAAAKEAAERAERAERAKKKRSREQLLEAAANDIAKDGSELMVLNTQKRDRRSLEEIQRDMKKAKTE